VWIVWVSLIELCNGLRALLISDTPKNDDDDADNNTGKSKSQKKRVGIRNKNSEDNVMQVSLSACILYSYSSKWWK